MPVDEWYLMWQVRNSDKVVPAGKFMCALSPLVWVYFNLRGVNNA
jgi:hypothetical protein